MRDSVEELDRSEAASEKEELLECLELAREKVDDVLLKSDRAGDVVIELEGELLRLGVCGVVIDGTWTSFRTTIRER